MTTIRNQRHELFQIEDQDGTQVRVLDLRGCEAAKVMTVREARSMLFNETEQDAESPYMVTVISQFK